MTTHIEDVLEHERNVSRWYVPFGIVLALIVIGFVIWALSGNLGR
jgi:hypothetical protein